MILTHFNVIIFQYVESLRDSTDNLNHTIGRLLLLSDVGFAKPRAWEWNEGGGGNIRFATTFVGSSACGTRISNTYCEMTRKLN
jgi:hypothetical protein